MLLSSHPDIKVRKFKGKNLYVKPKGSTRRLMQKLFLKLLLNFFQKDFLYYKKKIRIIMNRSAFFLRFYAAIVYFRFRYPFYFRLPSKQLYAIAIIIKFLGILKPQKIDFFLLDGSLLGALRQGSFAGRPKDIDLGIKEAHLKKLLDAFPVLIKNGVKTIRKEANKKIDKIQFLFSCILIDIVVFRKKNIGNKKMWVGKKEIYNFLETKKTNNKKLNTIILPFNDLEHLTVVKAYGKEFLSPAKPKVYLKKTFGKNWMTPDKKQFFWNKKISK